MGRECGNHSRVQMGYRWSRGGRAGLGIRVRVAVDEGVVLVSWGVVDTRRRIGGW